MTGKTAATASPIHKFYKLVLWAPLLNKSLLPIVWIEEQNAPVTVSRKIRRLGFLESSRIADYISTVAIGHHIQMGVNAVLLFKSKLKHIELKLTDRSDKGRCLGIFERFQHLNRSFM
jgi:hypothetical protein